MFVIDALRPRFLIAVGSELPKPSFFESEAAWRQVWDEASRWGATGTIAQLVYRTSWWGELPEAVRLRINEKLGRSRLEAHVLMDELQRALQILMQERIAVALTGAVELGARYYPDLAMRVTDSMDLLVEPGNFNKALYALGRGDYRALSVYREGINRIELQRRLGGPTVMLYRSLVEGQSEKNSATVFERTTDARVPGLPGYARLTAPKDLLLFLLQKKRDRSNLISPTAINDLYFLIKKSELDEPQSWRSVFEEIHSAGLSSLTWLSLQFVESRAPGSIAPQIFSELASRMSIYKKLGIKSFANWEAWHSNEPRGLSWKLRSVVLDR